jgi:hypothetical protein
MTSFFKIKIALLFSFSLTDSVTKMILENYTLKPVEPILAS